MRFSPSPNPSPPSKSCTLHTSHPFPLPLQTDFESENAKLEYKCAFFLSFHFLSLSRFAKYKQCFLSHFGCVCLCVCVGGCYCCCCYCNLQLLNVARLVANDFIVLH